MTVLVTGATGFVGRFVVDRLLSDGYEVRLAVREHAAVANGAEVVHVGEVGPQTDWSAALLGVETVIHLAARVHVMNDRSHDRLAAFRHVNTDGTRRLAQSCRAIEHFIYMSSIKAAVDESVDFVIDEATPSLPTSAYGISKLEAERQLAAEAENHGFRWTVLRPPLVFGEGVGGNFARLLRLCRRGLPLPLASVRNRRSLIYAGNLADIIVRALERRTSVDAVVPVTDGPPRSTGDLVRTISAAMGTPARLLPVPPRLLHGLAKVTKREDLYRRLCGNLEIVPSAARTALDWTPPFSFEEGIGRTVAAFCAGAS